MLLALTACTGGQTTPQQDVPVLSLLPRKRFLLKQKFSKRTLKGPKAVYLVLYFSATGSTERLAGFAAEDLRADIYEIVPTEPYTSDDLDWRDESSRVSVEHEDPSLRPALAGELPKPESYDTVLLGCPLWWRQDPHVVRTFLESVNLSGKTVIPFCTSSSSELGDSAENLHSLAPDAQW